jgi:NADPH2:quinone reductase
MRAVVVDRLMEPSELTVSEAAEPALGPGTIKVAVKAAAMNFSDILIVRGQYQLKPPLPFILGGELAGEVLELGEGVERFAVGDRVLASPGLGAFAESAVVDADDCYPLPSGIDFAQAAALPIVYGTSYTALVYRADLQAGETLLVHAAAGGVGLAAVQIGKALGARVIATAGSPEKLEVALREGADVGIDYSSEDFVERVKGETAGRGADVIYDSVGGDVFDRSTKCIAWNGRLLVVGFASGRIPELKMNRLMLKNCSVVGVNWGGLAAKEPERMREVYRGLFEMLEKGAVRPVLYARYSLEQVPQALEALGSRATWGKLIVEP